MVSELERRIELIKRIPEIRGTRFDITSEETPIYNCIAWAANDNTRFWWPDGGYWPKGCKRNETVQAFKDAFSTLGFSECVDGDYVPETEKVVFYVENDLVRHAARQIGPEKWTSKLGRWIDISHELTGLRSAVYGEPTVFLSRKC